MSTLPFQISVQVDPDDRLVAAVGGVARYLADAAGLGNGTILQFQAAVVSACKHCFRCYAMAAHCEITLRRSLDRLEVEVTLPETEPSPNENPAWEGFDEVHRESRERASILRLTKFVSPNPPAD